MRERLYAAACKAERREAGPYSRVTHEYLFAFGVSASDEQEAYRKALVHAKRAYTDGYYSVSVAPVAHTALPVPAPLPFGISQEGASWAMEEHPAIRVLRQARSGSEDEQRATWDAREGLV